jgi:hypothetical protein
LGAARFPADLTPPARGWGVRSAGEKSGEPFRRGSSYPARRSASSIIAWCSRGSAQRACPSGGS